MLPQTLDKPRTWVKEANGEGCALILKALQVKVAASKDQILIEGEIPPIEEGGRSTDQDLVTIERTSG